jgi:hypothetical protein
MARDFKKIVAWQKADGFVLEIYGPDGQDIPV